MLAMGFGGLCLPHCSLCVKDNIRFLFVKPEGDTQIVWVVNKEEDRLLLESELNCLVKRSQFEKMPF